MPPPPPMPLSLAVPWADDEAGVVPPPPVSPITPTLPPAHLSDVTPQQPLPSPVSRLPVYTHAKQPDQVAAQPPPPPEPIDFDTNPDVLALKSAISVLQVQKKRAAADIHSLSSARDAALDDADAFVRDLAAGNVNASNAADVDNAKPWTSLPCPQDVVRCPPINWSQYAVVGDSLDKLHAEEVRRPSQGIPATVGPDGSYEFKGVEGPRETYPGVATPFAPGKDRIERKPKAKR
ncbi:hypothetical protein L249_5790 [Ophiocordyceps polyrhachis-furcata BCC 54312]|uniref:Uncharacterized protein n=1 Tax=Ophiocordyceps polyrhachis-furcata BCC 54312 TaxID=1330021 RepID=A0A367L0S2_9HYPO|nr:hypothetical protein L249_5790 [Ophiocordyceps polyrhachis-furcata BCC 54312]